MRFLSQIRSALLLAALVPGSCPASDAESTAAVSLNCEKPQRDEQRVSDLAYVETPLFGAIERHEIEYALCLIGDGARVDEVGYNGWTPLSRAAQFGLLPVVQSLLESGADPNRRDEFGKTAYEYASEFYWHYSTGDFPVGYLGEDPESRVDDYRQIVLLLDEARLASPKRP